ncbi:MAG: HAD-IA family hydrolase [Vicinamibacterales bacterium]
MSQPRPLPLPRAVLFDLFHTLVSIPTPESMGFDSIGQILGVPPKEWERLFYQEDVCGRALGDVTDAVEAMRRVTHLLDATVGHDRIHRAVESRRRRLEVALIQVDPAVLDAIDRVRAAGIRTALISDAGADDVECWEESPLRERFDVTCFSYALRMRKPDARIYRHALDTLGVAPADALFVGDGGSSEHRGARALGIGTVLVTRLVGQWWPHVIEERRAHADWEFEDVPAFVDALALADAVSR